MEGWAKPAYLLPGTPVPRRWAANRGAAEPVRLADLVAGAHPAAVRLPLQLEVYVPAGRRVYGYYVMPVLAAGRLVARVDPKHDRQAGRLVIRGFHVEDGVDFEFALETTMTASRLAAHLGVNQISASPGNGAHGAIRASAPAERVGERRSQSEHSGPIHEWYTCRDGGIATRPSIAEIDRLGSEMQNQAATGWEWLGGTAKPCSGSSRTTYEPGIAMSARWRDHPGSSGATRRCPSMFHKPRSSRSSA